MTTPQPTLLFGDCIASMRKLPDCSVDAIVTDPPYGLSFMGKKWDYDVPSVEVWAECLRVLKPGGHLLAFAGTRTQHRMAVRIEDAGFEIRDMIAWVYGSGFPKSLDVSKAIDKAAGAEREVIGSKLGQPGYSLKQNDTDDHERKAYGKFTDAESECAITAPATEAARQWQGWGTALKPALEPITVARKPLVGTVAANVLEHGTGALNIDGCRVGDEGGCRSEGNGVRAESQPGAIGSYASSPAVAGLGRWPANLIHDGSDEVLAAFPQAPGQLATASTSDTQRAGQNTYGTMARGITGQEPRVEIDKSAARFFYCAKASKRDRGEGNAHPTVKPTDLMRYLCRLVTPPGGVVLDPFMGSGSTGVAAILDGCRFIGCERDLEYFSTAWLRVELAVAQANRAC